MITGSKIDIAHQDLTYGMVGGGPGALIGEVHRSAIRLNQGAQLVCGVFSRDRDKSREFGLSLGIDAQRLYISYEEMATKEAERDDGIDFVVVVTPNAFHYETCKAFLLHGIHVVCDKPLAITPEEAEDLVELSRRKQLLFAVTYTYTGYAAVKQIAHLVAAKAIGEIRFVHAEYIQEWLAEKSEEAGNPQAAWRTDPKLSGISNCVGDIGSHVENLVATMTGLRIKRLCARLDTFVEGRSLDDNASIMVEYDSGAKGLYWVSQIAIGHDNGLKIRICGSLGTIEWFQEDPDHFSVMRLHEPAQQFSRGRDAFCTAAEQFSRLPGGHPEGFFEAFANIYQAYTQTLTNLKLHGKIDDMQLGFPTVDQGADGVKFVSACVESSQRGSAWVEL
jgi:predicted dehydrogenase